MTHYDHTHNWKVQGRLQAGLQAQGAGDAVILDNEGMIPNAFIHGGQWTYGLAFDQSVLYDTSGGSIASDPRACLTYTRDCTNFVPVTNTNGVIDTGSWNISRNAMLKDCFYATFKQEDNTWQPYEKLNPLNLAQVIALWNGEYWEDATGTSHNTTHDTMFCIPKRSVQRNANGILMSSDPNFGDLSAFRYGNRTAGQEWDYLGIGVYPASIVNDNLMSVSGQTPAGSLTRNAFRTLAATKGGNWHLWNWHEYALLRDMQLFCMKDFNTQAALGNGVSSGGQSGVKNTGLTDALGPFAGDVSGTTTPVKCLVDHAWANTWMFIDDIYLGPGQSETVDSSTYYYQAVYAGTNSASSIDCSVSTGKTQILDKWYMGTPSGTNMDCQNKPIVLATGQHSWSLNGAPIDAGATNKGTCDNNWRSYHTEEPSSDTASSPRGRNFLVGGSSDSGASDGVFAVLANHTLSRSSWTCGARLAFTF